MPRPMLLAGPPLLRSAAINRAAPVAAGLLDLWATPHAAGPPINMARPERLAVLGSTSAYGGSIISGAALTFAAGAGDAVNLGSYQVGLTDPKRLSIAALIRTNDPTTRKTVYGTNNVTGVPALEINGQAGGTFGFFINGVFVTYWDAPGGWDNQFHWLVITRDGGDVQGSYTGYIDGKLATIAAGGGGYASAFVDAAATQRWLGQRSAASQVFNGQIAYVGIWDRVLSAADAQRLYDPATRWELFRPVRWRVLVQGDGGAGGQTLEPPLIASTATIFAPTVTPGAVSLAPPLIASTSDLFAPTVTPGAVTLTPPLIGSAGQLFAPAVTPGAVQLSPPLIASTAALFAPTVTAGGQLLPPLIDSTAQVFAPTVTPGAIAVSPPLIASAAQVFTPVLLAGFVLQPPRIESAAQLFGPVLTVGSVSLLVPLLGSATVLYAPTLSGSGVVGDATRATASDAAYGGATAGDAALVGATASDSEG